MGMFSIKNYVAEKYIGRGSTSKVYQGRNTKTNERVAIKRMDLKAIKNCQFFFEREINIMKNIDNPHIIKLHDYIEDSEKKKAYIILEYCQYGDLSHFLKKRPLKEKYAKSFITQLADELRFLLGKNIMHRDLKPQNILISDNKKIKITDFGLARYFDNQNMIDTICGSPLYMSPEIMKNNKYDNKSDLWSVGVILYEMMVGELPYIATNHYQLVKKIQRDTVKIPEKDYLSISPECRDLIYRLLDKNPETRIGWIDFFDHPWLTNPIERMFNRIKNNNISVHLQQIEINEDKYDTFAKLKVEELINIDTGDNNNINSNNINSDNVDDDTESSINVEDEDIDDIEQDEKMEIKEEIEKKQDEIENEYLNEYIEEDFDKVINNFDETKVQIGSYMKSTLYETAPLSKTRSIDIPSTRKHNKKSYESPDSIMIDGLTPSSKYVETYGTSPIFNEIDDDNFIVVQNPPSRDAYGGGEETTSTNKRIQNYLDYSIYIFKKGTALLS